MVSRSLPPVQGIGCHIPTMPPERVGGPVQREGCHEKDVGNIPPQSPGRDGLRDRQSAWPNRLEMRKVMEDGRERTPTPPVTEETIHP